MVAVRYHSAMAVHSLAADVVDSLGRRIVNGHLQPGDVLRLDLIGTEFKVSRSVSREAMRVLESLGLVGHVAGWVSSSRHAATGTSCTHE